MFYFEEKLKDLKVELTTGNIYRITYKDEEAEFILNKDLEVIEKVILKYHKLIKRIDFEDGHKIYVGSDKYSTNREVWHFSTPDQILPTLRCGYTTHIGISTWSSTPHPFELKPEPGFEEVFLYFITTGYGKSWSQNALQIGEGLWQDGSKIGDVWTVANRDISAIPMGYHPVVGEPGVHVSYIWAYLAKHKNWEKLP